jgi:outer membrane murein-binding lipoprotein Lpp
VILQAGQARMTERDSDIEFDFFDEPETEEATERVRTPRRPPPGGGPRRPVRPPQGFIPMLRLAGLIAFLILAVVLLVVGIRGCASSSKHDKYEGYISDVRSIAQRSDQIGKDLNRTLSATGVKETDLEAKISGLAAQQQQEVAQALQLNPPGPLRVEHDHLIEVLKLRASGLSRLADAFRQTATARNASTSGRLIADQTRLLAASDVNWDFYFKEPTQTELQHQNITDIGGVPDSSIFPNPDLASTQAMTDVWRRVHGAATGGTPGGKHGSALVSVTALPDGKKLNPNGAATDNQITASTDLAFQVAVTDSGDFQEFNVGVTLTIQKTPKPIVLRKTIDTINAGETKTVTFTSININGLFGLPTTVKVDIQPVPGETTKSNNSAEYKVIFSLGG